MAHISTLVGRHRSASRVLCRALALEEMHIGLPAIIRHSFSCNGIVVNAPPMTWHPDPDHSATLGQIDLDPAPFQRILHVAA